ncbi:hypothetical protein KVT40_008626 [Elsinoe batatas]|uniref:DUF6594 domain-containing protein n=1 Tax=Elsinoe batatas TaxID=2601811 RepID=A0A8K0KXE6_9PEZI|nr:hypothetical protein KVT40_008626 [Elsinoe batatas]
MTQNKYDRATGNVRLPGQAESVGYLVRGPHAAAPGTETIPAHPQLRSSSSSRSSSATGTNTAIPTPTAILTTSAYRATYRQGTNIGGEDHSSPVHGYGSELYGQFHPLQPFQQAIYAPTSDSNADNQSQYARMQQILDRTPRQHYPKRGPTANGEGESTSGQNSEQRSHGPETGAAPPDNVFRRFMSLHHRLIAQIQSDLVIYESQLAGLEQRIRTYPGPDVGHLQDLQERRRAILAHVFQKLEQYRKAIDLASSNAALESPSPSTELFDNTEYFVIPIRQDPMKDRDMLATHESFDSSSQSSQFDEAKPSHDCPTNTEDEVATTKSEPAPTIGDSEISSAASLSECTQFALACGILIVLCRLLPFALAKLRDRGPALELIICTILPVIFSTISLISLLIGIDKDIRTASRLSRSERMKLAWLVVGAIFSWYSYELYGTLGAFLHLLAVVSAVFAFLLSSNPPCEAELTAATDEPRLPKTVEGDAVGECTKETSSSDAPTEARIVRCLLPLMFFLPLFSAFTPAVQLYQQMSAMVLGVSWAIGISRFLVIKTFLFAIPVDGLRKLAYEPMTISLWSSALTFPWFCYSSLFRGPSDWHVERLGESIAAYRAQLTIQGETGSLRKAHLKDLESLFTRLNKPNARRKQLEDPIDTGKGAS